MRSRSWKNTGFFVVTAFLSFHVHNVLARDYKAKWQRSTVSVEEIEKSLFSHKDDPFADEDKWAGLPDDQREAWTASNEVVQLSEGMEEVLKRTTLIRQKGVVLPVDVLIVAPERYLSKDQVARIEHYAAAMRAGRNGTSLTFKVSVAEQTLYKRISMHDPSQNPADFMGILEQTAVTLGALNVLFIIVNHQDEPVNEYASRTPFVGGGRVSWVLYNIEKGHDLNIASVLTAAERAAERVYAPQPLYFPIPLIRQLRVELAAYTPGHEHRALWLQNFAWNEFETSVRSVAVHGQTVGFFSSQANAECPKCERAFHDVEKYERDFTRKAAVILNNDFAPNQGWANGQASTHSKKRIPANTFRLYVLDTTKVRKNEVIQRLERRPLSLFPGMGIITFRSSDEQAAGNLESQLIKAIVAGVYGIAEPDLYMHPRLGRQISKRTKRPSPVLFDIVIRNLVRSVVEKHLTELDEIVDGILYFDVDPTKSLGDHEYAYFAQRVNLMLFKLERAQHVLGEFNDGAAALYLASSTFHDIKAIRGAFDLTVESRSFEQFRDPTLRCHFSRLRREALKASQILESGYPNMKSLLLATLSFTIAAIITNFVLERHSSRKSRGKRE